MNRNKNLNKHCHNNPNDNPTAMINKLSISPTEITRLDQGSVASLNDFVAVEEPLEIRVSGGNANPETEKNIAITMRTPGNDADLAVGFLFTEGIITSKQDVVGITPKQDQSSITIQLHEQVNVDLGALERHFYTTSSCGVCGKASIDAVQVKCKIALPQTQWKIPSSLLFHLPNQLREAQSTFQATGGIHGCALFDLNGVLVGMAEDVGRHNALDKLIGAWLNGSLNFGSLHHDKLNHGTQNQGSPNHRSMQDENLLQSINTHTKHLQTPSHSASLSNHILLLSGRISFELVQKAAMAGIRMIVAVGAPSSLAVDLADELGITLVGFLRGERCNVYTHPQRIDTQSKSPQP